MIAERLGTNRQAIARMLREAEAAGIVTVQVRLPVNTRFGETFTLQMAEIFPWVRHVSLFSEEVRPFQPGLRTPKGRAAAVEVATFMLDQVHRRETTDIVVGGGLAIHDCLVMLAMAAKRHKWKKLLRGSVAPLIGVLPKDMLNSELVSTALSALANAEAFNAGLRSVVVSEFPMPAWLDVAEREMLRRGKALQEVGRIFEGARIVCSEIWTPELTKDIWLDPNLNIEIAGSLSGISFDEAGKPLSEDLQPFGMEPQQIIQKAETTNHLVIGVAYLNRRRNITALASAVLAALRGKWINALFIDKPTAYEMVSQLKATGLTDNVLPFASDLYEVEPPILLHDEILSL